MKGFFVVFVLWFLFICNAVLADTVYYTEYNFGKFSSFSTVRHPVSETFVVGQKQKAFVSVENVKFDEQRLFAKKLEDAFVKKIKEEMEKLKKSEESLEKVKSLEKEGREQELRLEVYFNFGSFVLSGSEKKKIDRFLEENISVLKDKKAYVDGYADCVGSKQYNLKLSGKRARAVAEYLKSKGFEVAEYKGWGERKEHDVLCLNRVARVIFK